jgi:hypothetical protein
MGDNGGENIFKPSARIDLDPLAGSHETPEHCGGLAALVAAKEHPIVSTHSDAADGSLSGVVVDL